MNGYFFKSIKMEKVEPSLMSTAQKILYVHIFNSDTNMDMDFHAFVLRIFFGIKIVISAQNVSFYYFYPTIKFESYFKVNSHTIYIIEVIQAVF